MEITIIHGINHKGSTYSISNMIKENIADSNTIINEYFMPKDAPEYCVGCFQCIKNDEKKCPQAEKAQRILTSMINSDILIFDSPTYCYEMTAQLKVLFDHYGFLWMVHRPRQEMFSKIGIVVSTAAGAGAKRVTKSISTQMAWWGVSNIYQLHINVQASKWEEVSPKIKQKIDIKIKKITKQVKNKLGKTKTSFKTKLIFNFMRKIHSINNWNKIDKEYWLQNEWSGKKRPWHKK
jgi:multimeric flavodoxin WrbA